MQNRVLGHLQLQQQQRGRSRRRSNEDEPPRPCHRLDLNTSGVLAFAKTAQAATALMGQFEGRLVRKTYAALCTASPTRQFVDAPICRVDGVNHAERRLCEEGEEGGQSAVTQLRIAATTGDGDANAGHSTGCRQRCPARALGAGTLLGSQRLTKNHAAPIPIGD